MHKEAEPQDAFFQGLSLVYQRIMEIQGVLNARNDAFRRGLPEHILQNLRDDDGGDIEAGFLAKLNLSKPNYDKIVELSGHPFTFATAMRACLRADPDVILIGEMRDHETASIGIEASLTGHLILSTLHTNSSPETFPRRCSVAL